MSSISIILIFIIFTVSVYYVVQPLFGEAISPGADEAEAHEALLLRKKVILQQIKELEMDQEIGNIDDDDFQDTRNALKKEAAEVLELIKKTGK